MAGMFSKRKIKTCTWHIIEVRISDRKHIYLIY